MLLAKQAWRVLQNPNSLSARILKAKYFPQSSFLSAELGGSPSQVWRGICDGRDILIQGLIKRIGDGTSTRIMEDNWIPRDHLLQPVCMQARNPPEFVSELMVEATRSWDLDRLRANFLPMDVEAIQRIPISHMQQPDFWAWHYDRKGFFSV